MAVQRKDARRKHRDGNRGVQMWLETQMVARGHKGTRERI